MHINVNDALNILQTSTNILKSAKKTTSANTSTNSATTTSSGANADKNVFMTLLVEQLKHQDPLAPQDGSAFVAQLAQFNSLEQLTSINQRLGLLLEQNNS